MEEFIPTTFRMDVREEREAFFAQQEGKMSKHISPTLTPDASALWCNNNTSPTGFVIHQLLPVTNDKLKVTSQASTSDKEHNSLCLVVLRQQLP